ncbi:MAG: hypothetical protein EPO11_04125 [Gammaproteobacteria bacterium]|nr:MAG: hypothetical protein EPO11_04125 [Gammaproteobacteria bacterium]
MKKLLTLFITCTLFLSISGCGQNLSTNTYESSDVGVASKVKKGTIIAKRPVDIDNSTGVGGLAGAGAGAAAGSMIGGNTAVNIISAIGGAVIGGVAGHAAEKGLSHHQGYEYIIQLDKGSTISVVQSAEETIFNVNQHVLVIYGSKTRIVADETVTPSTKHTHT